MEKDGLQLMKKLIQDIDRIDQFISNSHDKLPP